MKRQRLVVAVLVGSGILAAALITALAPAPALAASAHWCAEVKQTPDGFLNLRKAPTAQSAVLMKLFRGDMLGVDNQECEKRADLAICDYSGGRWVHVNFVSRVDNDQLFEKDG